MTRMKTAPLSAGIRESGRSPADTRLGNTSVGTGHRDIAARDLLDDVALALDSLTLAAARLLTSLILGYLLGDIVRYVARPASTLRGRTGTIPEIVRV